MKKAEHCDSNASPTAIANTPISKVNVTGPRRQIEDADQIVQGMSNQKSRIYDIWKERNAEQLELDAERFCFHLHVLISGRSIASPISISLLL